MTDNAAFEEERDEMTTKALETIRMIRDNVRNQLIEEEMAAAASAENESRQRIDTNQGTTAAAISTGVSSTTSSIRNLLDTELDQFDFEAASAIPSTSSAPPPTAATTATTSSTSIDQIFMADFHRPLEPVKCDRSQSNPSTATTTTDVAGASTSTTKPNRRLERIDRGTQTDARVEMMRRAAKAEIQNLKSTDQDWVLAMKMIVSMRQEDQAKFFALLDL